MTEKKLKFGKFENYWIKLSDIKKVSHKKNKIFLKILNHLKILNIYGVEKF